MSEYYIVIDKDEQRRHAMCTLLSVEGYVIPLGSIDEIQGRWPEQAWIFAGCDRDNLEYICRYLKNAERFYPIVPFGKSPSDRLIMDLINLGCIGYISMPSNGHVIGKTISALRAAAARVMAQRGRQMEADRKMRLLSPAKRRSSGRSARACRTNRLPTHLESARARWKYIAPMRWRSSEPRTQSISCACLYRQPIASRHLWEPRSERNCTHARRDIGDGRMAKDGGS